MLLFQWLFVPLMDLKGVRPDVILLFVMYLGLFWNPTGAMLVGFFLGLGQDTLNGSAVGLSALTLTIVAYVPHLLGARLFLSSVVTHLAMLIGFSLCGDLLRSFYYWTVGQEVSIRFMTRSIGHLTWNIVFYFALFRSWMEWLPLEKRLYED